MQRNKISFNGQKIFIEVSGKTFSLSHLGFVNSTLGNILFLSDSNNFY